MVNPLSYAVVSPVRDEAKNLVRLCRCLAEQTVPPARWVIVDTGSTDGTQGVASSLVTCLPGTELQSVAQPTASPTRGGPVVVALHLGFAALQGSVDVVVKVDADVSFGREHMEQLLAQFERDPRLGIASGVRHELVSGTWCPRYSTHGEVEAQCRAYRQECLTQILPLEQRLGWDTIDVARAISLGWNTAVTDATHFRHHRPMGERDGSPWRSWYAQGKASHYLHYRPGYTLARGLYRARREPAALALIVGFASASLQRQPREPAPELRRFVRDKQRLRYLNRRRRETVGCAKPG
jgi:glycosyltransferase involved in cell wall biosynthesis